MNRFSTILTTICLLFLFSVVSSESGSPVSVASAAQVDYFLKIDGIPGESRSESHRNEIEILSFSWGASSSSTGNAARSGKISAEDLVVTKVVDKSSPKLMQACLSGQHFPEAIISLQRAGERVFDYFVVRLEDVQCTSYAVEGSGGQNPTESMSLNFTKIEYKYTTMTDDGSADSTEKAGYDLKKNVKV